MLKTRRSNKRKSPKADGELGKTSPTLSLLPLDATILLCISRRQRNDVEFHVNLFPNHSSEPYASEEAVVDQRRFSRCLGTRSLMRFSPEERPSLICDLSPHFPLLVRSVDSFSPLLW